MIKVEVIVGEFADGYTIQIPEEARYSFPPNGTRYETFTIRNNDHENLVWVSKRHSSGKLDHIHVTHTYWWKGLKSHPEKGDRVVIDVAEVEGKQQYSIR